MSQRIFLPTLLAMTIGAVVADDDVQNVEVYGSAKEFRMRLDTTSPRLSYDTQYFAPFEPISVGDMLKRVPGVSFVSDIGEYDSPQMRGLSKEYTQVLINGKRIPGGAEDRSVAVDRIPAEMVERIELIRSPSSDMDAQGIGGTINIVLKDAKYVGGNNFRLGQTFAADGENKPNVFASWGGGTDKSRISFAAEWQQRYNAKDKTSQAFEDGEQVGNEQQADVRDSDDKSLSMNGAFDLSDTMSMNFNSTLIKTQRDEDELTDVFEDGELDATEFEHENIEEETMRWSTEWRSDVGSHSWRMEVGNVEHDVNIRNDEGEKDAGVEVLDEYETLQINDKELSLNADIVWFDLGNHDIKTGVVYGRKNRDTENRLFEEDGGEFEEETTAYGIYQVEETRQDLFVQDIWSLSDDASVEMGVRAERTELLLEGSGGKVEGRYSDVSPSLHWRYHLNGDNVVRFSAAKTVRRPLFNELVPFEQNDEPDDEVLRGNPDLQPEKATGLDLGWEYRFAKHEGIFGLNLFYRDITDVIELAEIETDVFTRQNTNDGTLWGVELDASLPLTALSLENVNVYFNASWQDSEIDDPVRGITRRFNNQAPWVYNVGFNHYVETIDTRYGLSFQKQDEVLFYEAEEIQHVRYDGNLELFIEKPLSKNYVLRVVGSNLLDAEKNEFFDAGDETEREQERAGRLWMVTLRGKF